MAMRVRKWDREELKAIAAKLETLAGTIEDEKKLLTDSVIVLSDEWKGLSGSAYIRVSSQTSKELDDLINSFINTANTLKGIIGDYENAENAVMSAVSQLV